MSESTREAMLEIIWSREDKYLIDCILTIPPDEHLNIRRGESPSLVMDTSRPTRVGWRWSPFQEAGSDTPSATAHPYTPSGPDPLSIGFSYSLYKKDYWAPALADEVDAFFPIGASSYSTDAEIDSSTGTIWFPLPEGRCLYNLEVSFDLDTKTLDWFVESWFADRDKDPPLPFVVTPDGHYDDETYCQHCSSKTTDSFECVDIPADLLRDPIRNGSIYLEHGFNPWNEDQKAQIVAHLEGELVRLTEFFQSDATSCEAKASVG
jgi:hypothetical protein